MGEGRGHEILLSLMLSGSVSTTEMVRFLRSTPLDTIAQTAMETVLERLGLAGEHAASVRQSMCEASRLCRRLSGDGIGMVAFGQPDYPPLLNEIPSPPVIIFFRGCLAAADPRAVAVVGSRKPSLAGVKMATYLAKELASLGFTIVSGLARGIDTAAHRGALKAGGRTIAVLGSGIDIIYPPENQELARSVSSSGAIVTELLPGTEPLKYNFPRRNRIISGLTLGTVVVEAGGRSGALITANCALEQNRAVFAVPGAPGYANSKGTNRLLKEGARLVESVEDILEEICPQLESAEPLLPIQRLPLKLTTLEETIMGLLSDAPAHVDEISRSLHLESHRILSLLLSLETRGLVRSMPGKFYVRQ